MVIKDKISHNRNILLQTDTVHLFHLAWRSGYNETDTQLSFKCFHTYQGASDLFLCLVPDWQAGNFLPSHSHATSIHLWVLTFNTHK